MAEDERPRILAMNSGSSSIKFAVFLSAETERVEVSGLIDEIGSEDSRVLFEDGEGRGLLETRRRFGGHEDALEELASWLLSRYAPRDLDGVGYRVVHGGERFHEPQPVTAPVLAQVERLIPFAPYHLPAQLADMRLLMSAFSSACHVACFDTAFHRDMPAVAQLYALPTWTRREGIIRYGFHGLSYEYILSALEAGRLISEGERVVIAHLGNGASMAAVRDGRSVETTMGFTPTGGLVMSTRSGDLDPGVLLYLLEQKGMPAEQVARLVTRESGLLGMSEGSSDMETLLRREARDERAAEAVALFCHQARKYLGGLIAVLGGLDTLVFTGGIGENAAPIRSRICSGLQFLGLALDEALNASGAPVVSTNESRVRVRVIKTDEEVMIARYTKGVLQRLRGDGDEQRSQTA